MGVLVFLGQGLRISVLATRNFICKPLQTFIQDILQYIKLYSDALKYELYENKTQFFVYPTTITILLFGWGNNSFLYFFL